MKLFYFRWIKKYFKSLFFVIFIASIFFVVEKENIDVRYKVKDEEEKIEKSSKMSYTPFWSDSTIIQYELFPGDASTPPVYELFISIALIDDKKPVTIKWGDGYTTVCRQDDLYTHKYYATGKYYVEICDNLKTFSRHFNTLHIQKSNEQMRRIERIASTLKDLSYLGYNAKNLYFVVDDYPTEVTDVYRMFDGAKKFNSPVSTLDTSLVKDTSFMFCNTNFNHSVSHFKTLNVESMNGMFSYTPFNQPLNNFDTKKVTNMRSMFENALNFNQPLDNFNTSNVRNMSFMFANTPFNQSLDNFNTSNVTNMRSMFASNSEFNQKLDKFDTSKVTTMKKMFYNASKFNQSLDKFDTANVTDMSEMFAYTPFNQSLDNFNTANVIDMSEMFAYTPFNKSLDKFDTSKVKNMERMFKGTAKFNQLLDKFDTANVTNMSEMFSNTLEFNQPLNKFDTSKVTNMWAMFKGAAKFNQSLDKFDTANVISMNNMFADTLEFNKSLDKFDTSNVKDMSYMFKGAAKFNQLLDKFDTSNVTNMSEMFADTLEFNQLLDKFDTSKVTNMRAMFKGAAKFDQLLDKFDTANVTIMREMFANTLEFNQPLNNFDTSKVTTMSGMFYDARKFNQPINFNTSNVTNMVDMFRNAYKFSQDITNLNFKSLLDFRQLFLGSAITFDHYNSFIEKLANDKSGQKALDVPHWQYSVTHLKRSKPNKLFFDALDDFGFQIQDGGYYNLYVRPQITWKEIGYDYSFIITGAETETEKNDFLANVKHKEIMDAGMKYFEPYGLSEVKYFITYYKERLIQPIDMKNTKWNIIYWSFVYDGYERSVYLENIPKLLEGKISYTNDKFTYPGTYETEYFINIDPLLYEIKNPVFPKIIKWSIGKGVIDMKNVKWTRNVFTYSGENYEIVLDNLPIGVSATYTNNIKKEPGKYSATAEFNYIKAAYNLINEPYKTQSWEILKAPLSLRNARWEEGNFTWDGSYHKIEMIGYPSEVKVKYEDNNKIDPGKYSATVNFEYNENRYYLVNQPIKSIVWYIIKEIDLKDVEWSLSEFQYDDKEKKVELVNVASEIANIKYSGQYKAILPGKYYAYATFEYDKDKYRLINEPNRSITWSIFEVIDLAGAYWKDFEYEYDGNEKKVELIGISDKINVEYNENKKTDEGEYIATAKFYWDKTKYRVINEPINSFNWVIYQKIDLKDVKWTFKEFEYDGNEKKVELENMSLKINVKYSENTAINPNFYTAKADFDYNPNVYRVSNLPNNSFNWRIYQKIDLKDVEWNAEKFKYDGNEKEVYLKNNHIEVSFTYDTNTATEPNRYKTFAKIHYDIKKYIVENEPTLYLNWQIYHEINLENVEWNFKEFKWDGTLKKVELLNLPAGIKMNYRQGQKTNLGSYVTTAVPDYDRNKYVLINEPEYKLNWMIYTEIDYSNVRWNQESFNYDSKEKMVYLENLPKEIRVTYVGNTGKNTGNYLAKVSFLTDEKIYRPINKNIKDLAWSIKDERIEVEAENIEISEPSEVFEVIEENIEPTVKETVNNPQLVMFVIIGFSVVVSYEIFTIIKIKRGFR